MFAKPSDIDQSTVGELERNFDQKVANEMREISKKILENLEENMELKKTVSELKDIRDKHLKTHQSKIEMLERLRSDPKDRKQELDTLIRDIRVLEESIRSNVSSLDKAEKDLIANNEIREKLQKNLIYIHELQSKKLVGDLKLACQMLSHERKDLYMQNLEMKKKEEEMLRINEEKEKRINDLEIKLYETQRLINTKINEINTEIPQILEFNGPINSQDLGSKHQFNFKQSMESTGRPDASYAITKKHSQKGTLSIGSKKLNNSFRNTEHQPASFRKNRESDILSASIKLNGQETQKRN